jgi:hypothetical protein
MSILINALQHLPKGVSARQMPEQTTRVSSQRAALRSARIMTQLLRRTETLRGRRGFPDCPLASFLSQSQENLSCLRHCRSNQMFRKCQHTEELTVVRIIGRDGAVPIIGAQSRKVGHGASDEGQKLTSPSKPRISYPCGPVDKEGCFQVRYHLSTLLRVSDSERRDTTASRSFAMLSMAVESGATDDNDLLFLC